MTYSHVHQWCALQCCADLLLLKKCSPYSHNVGYCCMAMHNFISVSWSEKNTFRFLTLFGGGGGYVNLCMPNAVGKRRDDNYDDP